MKYLLTCCFIFFVNTTFCQTENKEEQPFEKKIMTIILSTKKYSEALKIAKEAAAKLHSKLVLNGLTPNEQEGLTMSKNECESNGWDYPCYVARGRWDDGEYISIEYSNAINGFAKGYYVVITATGEKSITGAALLKAKKFYKTAYNKQAKVYMGCMH